MADNMSIKKIQVTPKKVFPINTQVKILLDDKSKKEPNLGFGTEIGLGV